MTREPEQAETTARMGIATAATDPLLTRAFGMDVESHFPIPGISPLEHASDGRRLTLRRASEDEVRQGFRDGADRLAEQRFDDGTTAVYLDAAAEHGYLTYAYDFGHASIAPDGREALVASYDEPDWIWQRYLTGQVMPLAALLQGLEVFHACVLGIDGMAIAVVAQSGVGKTTLALQLALRGLDFMSDDVLVLEPAGNGVRAHPGIGLANLRPAARDLLPELSRAGLATVVGERDRETRIAVVHSNEPLPLGALFVLSRFRDSRQLELERLAPVDPRLLLASSFNFSVRTPERLARQLDVCARLERCAPVYRVSCGEVVGSYELAEAILECAGNLRPC